MNWTRDDEWLQMVEDEYEDSIKSKDKKIEDCAFKVMFELSPDHLAAVGYLLHNCVRSEDTNEDSHWKYIHNAVDLIKMGEEAFLSP